MPCECNNPGATCSLRYFGHVRISGCIAFASLRPDLHGWLFSFPCKVSSRHSLTLFPRSCQRLAQGDENIQKSRLAGQIRPFTRSCLLFIFVLSFAQICTAVGPYPDSPVSRNGGQEGNRCCIYPGKLSLVEISTVMRRH